MSENDSPLIKSIAVVGGTGKEGSALAKRWALNGYRVIIGSRSADKAEKSAAETNEELNGEYLTGMANEDAVQNAEIIVLSVPYSAHKSTLETIKPYITGKILVDVTVPIQPPNFTTVHVPEGKAASLESQAFLGEDVKVAAAFQNVSFVKLSDPQGDVNCDVLICGDDLGVKQEVMTLVEAAGMRGIDAGPLANAVAVEALTPVILYINKQHKIKSAGIRITGLDD
ncbi:NADPH-dependent F420 reductase [Phototrophicus methaneseepsis]|uniref:NADPH-dependent F420 reductase n=1 Tax=Phototrophicus methaneseepsis TaxID=2710758 RepID=UPI001E610D6D|nr:NADPH-dependent F420 reductase [Phototrophicus methaneseepsis]